MALIRTRLTPDIRPIGSNNTVLIADSTYPDGVRWGFVYPSSLGSGFAVLSFTSTSPSILAVGTGLVNPAFTISYNASASGATISCSSGTQTLTVPFTSHTWTGTFANPSSVNLSETFTVTASGTAGTDTETLTFYWQQYAYWGVKPTGSTLNAAFITALGASGFRATHSGSITFTGTTTGYYWYAFRTAAGAPIILDSGSSIVGGFQSVGVTGFVNGAGFSESYTIYRSDYPNLGTRTVLFV